MLQPNTSKKSPPWLHHMEGIFWPSFWLLRATERESKLRIWGLQKPCAITADWAITRHTQAQSSEEKTAFAFFHGKQTKSVELLDSLWFSAPCNASDYQFDYLDVEVNILSTFRMAFSSFFSVRCAYIRIIIVSSSCPIQRAAVLMSTSAL